MSVETLKRVVLRIQEWGMENKISQADLKRAIMLECGTDPGTISRNKSAMLHLRMIKRIQKRTYRVLDGDPT